MTAPAWLIARPIAHRGLHAQAAGIVENTLSAAAAAAEAGWAIECDVQPSRDGEAMVFHDHDLDRLTAATGPVRARTAHELATLAILGSSECIPPLAAFLGCVAGRVPLVIEIKSRFDGDLALARRTAALVRDYAGPVALKSFDDAVVAALRALAPDRPRGIVAQAEALAEPWPGLDASRKHRLANLLHFAETEPDFLSWRATDLPCAAPYLCRRLAGLPVLAWTVRDKALAERCRLHADQIVFEGFVPQG